MNLNINPTNFLHQLQELCLLGREFPGYGAPLRLRIKEDTALMENAACQAANLIRVQGEECYGQMTAALEHAEKVIVLGWNLNNTFVAYWRGILYASISTFRTSVARREDGLLY